MKYPDPKNPAPFVPAPVGEAVTVIVDPSVKPNQYVQVVAGETPWPPLWYDALVLTPDVVVLAPTAQDEQDVPPNK